MGRGKVNSQFMQLAMLFLTSSWITWFTLAKGLPLTVVFDYFLYFPNKKRGKHVSRTFLPLEFYSCCFFPMHSHNFLYVTLSHHNFLCSSQFDITGDYDFRWKSKQQKQMNALVQKPCKEDLIKNQRKIKIEYVERTLPTPNLG